MGEFGLLFTNMGIPAIICLSAGMILMIVEIFTLGFGVFGVCGIISLLAGVVLRILDGTTFIQILYLLLLIFGIISLFFIVVIFSVKKGLLSKSALVQGGVAIPKEYSDENYVYGFLVNKTGIVVADCKPVGAATIDNKTYDVLSEEGFIIKGSEIIVSRVQGEEIYVKKHIE